MTVLNTRFQQFKMSHETFIFQNFVQFFVFDCSEHWFMTIERTKHYSHKPKYVVKKYCFQLKNKFIAFPKKTTKQSN